MDDFISFLASQPFNEFARKEDPWVVFELGLYQDHTRTLQLIPSKWSLMLLDSNHTGAFENHVWEGDANDAMGRAETGWGVGVLSVDLELDVNTPLGFADPIGLDTDEEITVDVTVTMFKASLSLVE